ncbi:hypothetical protein [Flavobacterium sp.]|uniref:hypothetical protein n=1 Tax=Flavobacterium sp. TaxID=239 RepID=UPI002617E8EE|nr:hypothetical protein [Flavobacterium sp.]MDD2987124.1 hypothetical protein [Flavobacterium sp.]
MKINMKSKRRIIMTYFLRSLQDKLQWEDNVEPISEKWLRIYSKQELQEVVKWLFMQKIPEDMDLDKMDEEELLETIGDEFHLLGHLLSEMEEEVKAFENPTPQRLDELLEQLSSESHYLATKPIATWDDYDLSNYQALFRKAGMSVPLFGVYDADVKQDDRYTVTLPSHLYESQQEALKHLSELVEKGQFEEHQLQVMSL